MHKNNSSAQMVVLFPKVCSLSLWHFYTLNVKYIPIQKHTLK